MKINALITRSKPLSRIAIFSLIISFFSAYLSQAAGILTPIGSPDQLLRLEEHHLSININNGFAHTQVEQVFRNPNPYDLEAIYTTPIPEKGALSALRIDMGDRVLDGEVIRKEEANQVYEMEKAQGNDAGKATQNGYQHFEFRVSRVPANGAVRLLFSYYEALAIDTGIGRYAYTVEEGGTDDEASNFWHRNERVDSNFTIDLKLNSAWPVSNTRTPRYVGTTDQIDEKTIHYHYDSKGAAALTEDFVFYYKLHNDLPGRLEMLTYKEDASKPGTFMMLMTPGVDLQPITSGSDYVFVLDVSGSMKGKLHTLASGVKRAISKLRPEDRYRIVAFNTAAWDLHAEWMNATEDNLQNTFAKMDVLQAGDGTNLFNGITTGLNELEADRITSLILVTDGVANNGIVDSQEFFELLQGQDIRFFGFLLGNSGNWPLMQVLCEASGGYYKAVSNNDDIVGEILLAKNKIAYESMHQANLRIKGVDTFDVNDFKVGKIHYGEQLIFFGKYQQAGPAEVILDAKISGLDKRYQTTIEFPETSTDYPELERMWALDQVHKIQLAKAAGFAQSDEASQAIEDIGVAYQIVTEGTSMIALEDSGFARHGIARRNQERIAKEQNAQANRSSSQGAQRVDTAKPMYKRKSHSTGRSGGGGAIEPWMLGTMFLLGLLLVLRRTKLKSASIIPAAALLFVLSASPQSEAQTRSSVQDSIAHFWEISETEAKELPRVTPPPVRIHPRVTQPPYRSYAQPRPSQSQTVVVTQERALALPDTHSVTQIDRKKSESSTFGIRIFDSIPIINFDFGNKEEHKEDSYQGSLRR